jgi:RNase P protein component
MGRNFTWKKEKLKSRKRIERVFKEGRSFALFPYRVYFLLEEVRVGPASSGASRGEVFPASGEPMGMPNPGDVISSASQPEGDVGGEVDRGEIRSGESTGGTGQGSRTRGRTFRGSEIAGRAVQGGEIAGGPAGRGPLHAGFGASKRNFKRAVDRNRIKRLSREGYRLQKEALLRRLEEKGLSMAVFFIYTGRDLPDYPTVTEKIGVALHKLIKEIR